MNINRYLELARSGSLSEHYPIVPCVRCADEFSISVQANEAAYCHPRSNQGPWMQVEAGFPSDRPSEKLMEYAESPNIPTETVYGYVPVHVIEELIQEHGGYHQSILDMENL